MYSDTAPFCYFSFNDNGEIVNTNKTLCSALGYSKEELSGRKLETIFPVATRIFHQTHFFPLLRMHGRAEEIFIFLLTKNGEQLPVLMNALRLESEGIMQSQCACIIVRNRKKFEDELVKAKKAAEEALFENTALKKATEELADQTEKLDEHIQLVRKQHNELKQMSRIATHNLKEPLRKAMIFANMLKDKSQDHLLPIQNRLLKAVTQMNDTVIGLQQFIWLHEEKTTPVPIDLNLLVAEIKKQLAVELKEDLLEINVAGNFPVIRGDAKQIRLLFYHLLSNCALYRKPGSKAGVSISATILKRNVFKSAKNKYKFQDFLKIELTDDGLGFEPQYQTQIFELFKKLHHLNNMGLGLSFCKLIVENHGGSIEATGKPLDGTTITIFFPKGILA